MVCNRGIGTDAGGGGGGDRRVVGVEGKGGEGHAVAGEGRVDSCFLLPCRQAQRARGHLEREDMCARHVAYVNVHWRTPNGGIVPADGSIWCTVDECCTTLTTATDEQVSWPRKKVYIRTLEQSNLAAEVLQRHVSQQSQLHQ